MSSSLALEDAIEFLEAFNEQFPETMEEIIQTRWEVDEEKIDFDDDDSRLRNLVVGKRGERFTVGIIGLLNGFFDALRDERIAVNLNYPNLDDDATETKMRREREEGEIEINGFKLIDVEVSDE